MRKFALCALCVFGCAGTTRSVISPIDRIVMKDADAFVLMVRDPATGTLSPKRVYADEVEIVFDAPVDGSVWAEHVDTPGELRGEGDRLILHVRSLRDIE
ncbi:MAG: hypothetical protein WC866_05825 [Patescibacteria group bacterium]|jgi:hypothetical protein